MRKVFRISVVALALLVACGESDGDRIERAEANAHEALSQVIRMKSQIQQLEWELQKSQQRLANIEQRLRM